MKDIMEMTATEINGELQKFQEGWYENLDKCYKKVDGFSSPFCFGVSEQTIKERNNDDKPLLMYVGEEARNWWFDEYPKDYQKIQSWAIAYFETQIYPNLTDDMRANISALNDDDKKSAKKRNGSAFWDLLNELHKTNQYAVCWNNLDKLHKVVWNEQKNQDDKKRGTKTLGYEQEKELHQYGTPNRSLLWKEINFMRPEYIIFMGAKYDRSIEWALLKERALDGEKRPNIKNDNLVVNLTDNYNIFGLDYQPKVFWICHPSWLRRNGKLEEAFNKLKEIL